MIAEEILLETVVVDGQVALLQILPMILIGRPGSQLDGVEAKEFFQMVFIKRVELTLFQQPLVSTDHDTDLLAFIAAKHSVDRSIKRNSASGEGHGVLVL